MPGMPSKPTFPTPAASDFYHFDVGGRLSVCLSTVRCHPPGISGGTSKTASEFSPWWIMRTPLFWRDDSGDWVSIRFAKWRMQRYKNWKLPPELAAPIVVLSPIGEEWQAQLDADCPELATGDELRQGAALLDEVAGGGEPSGVYIFKRSHLKHALWYGVRQVETPAKHRPLLSWRWNELLGKSEEVDISAYTALERETLSLPWYNECMERCDKGLPAALYSTQERHAHVF